MIIGRPKAELERELGQPLWVLDMLARPFDGSLVLTSRTGRIASSSRTASQRSKGAKQL